MSSSAPIKSVLLSESGDGPLYLRLFRHLRELICSGEIETGSRLPSSRVLAADLGVSRSTVLSAIDQLVAEGFAEPRRGAGVFACDTGAIPGGLEALRHPPAEPKPQPAERQNSLLLAPGRADSSLFPTEKWAKTVARAARADARALHNCADSFGDIVLRHQIVRHLFEWRGLSVNPQQVVLTAGSGEALERALELVIRESAVVGLEDPGYPPLRRYVAARGWARRWLDVNAQGASVPPAGTSIGVAVITPSHQFPLGGAMPQARRAAFLEWARKSCGWIIEDDFDSDFRYSGQPIPALAALDGTRVIYVGSFSKVFEPGIRLGFMVLPESLIEPARETFAREPTRASVAAQRPLARFMADGNYLRHLRHARRVYSRRYEVLMRALDRHLSDTARWRRDNAGMSVACHLPTDIRDVDAAQALRRRSIGCIALSEYCARPEIANGLLVGFCTTAEHEIEDAVREVCSAVSKISRE